MANNRGVAYVAPGQVQVKSVEYPKLKNARFGDQPLRGKRRSARRDPKDRDHKYLRVGSAHGSRPHHGSCGTYLGHEITGEVIEKGGDVEMLSVGDSRDGTIQYSLRPLPQLP